MLKNVIQKLTLLKISPCDLAQKTSVANLWKTAFDCSFTVKVEVYNVGFVLPRAPTSRKMRKSLFVAKCENMLPMEHGKQNSHKNVNISLEVSQRDSRLRHL